MNKLNKTNLKKITYHALTVGFISFTLGTSAVADDGMVTELEDYEVKEQYLFKDQVNALKLQLLLSMYLRASQLQMRTK